ncbi:DUF547 domain-containing protein [Kordiimonas aquimaris]|uniref:DUF547 domain-containing protein n=1 Tax=Kordiimonas aquimaris TaxID=707591 RepID=UPI0021D1FA5E|nr:DUF547 domain-containing protein [Kordiimonas aquimaris]
MRQLRTIIILITATLTTSALALPYGDTSHSKYVIDYTDLSMILKGSVLDMGPSTHKPPINRISRATGSRILVGNTSITNQEGNRVLMHGFREPELTYLRKIRDDLLAVPSTLPLESLSRNEQLAYWLNLHNVIVLTKISEEYPVTYLNSFFDVDVDDTKSFINQKQFMFNDKLISVTDVQQHVLTYWKDPVVIYGFYMGAIGTPNIRTTAYTGTNVYNHLQDNATDFVNSLRGTQVWKSSELRISKYYERMSIVFPNFEANVKTHIEKYAKENLQRRMANTYSISVDIEDWHIADLYNGRPFQSAWRALCWHYN